MVVAFVIALSSPCFATIMQIYGGTYTDATGAHQARGTVDVGAWPGRILYGFYTGFGMTIDLNNVQSPTDSLAFETATRITGGGSNTYYLGGLFFPGNFESGWSEMYGYFQLVDSTYEQGYYSQVMRLNSVWISSYTWYDDSNDVIFQLNDIRASVPESTSVFLMGFGFVAIGLLGRYARNRSM